MIKRPILAVIFILIAILIQQYLFNKRETVFVEYKVLKVYEKCFEEKCHQVIFINDDHDSMLTVYDESEVNVGDIVVLSHKISSASSMPRHSLFSDSRVSYKFEYIKNR